MMSTDPPDISVVMSAFNSADSLRRTIASVLSQADVALELIVVNDGSTDRTRELLDEMAQNDSRLKPIHQENTGLTKALATACGSATARYIARQDAGGDVSLPGRLRQQLDFLLRRPEAAMVTCATRFVGPSDERLFDVAMTDSELDVGLRTLAIPGIRGPSHHGSTMFSREIYEDVGGYRPEYLVAQDMDLWLRMIEKAPCLTMPQICYQARFAPGGISTRLRSRQFAYGAAAIEAARCRRAGKPEPSFPLTGKSWTELKGQTDADELANFYYFLGSCLRENDRKLARSHLWKAARHRPLHLKTWLQLAGSYLPS